MERELRILIVEDVATDAELCQRELQRAGLKFTAQRVDTQQAFERALGEFRPEIILSDFSMPTGFDGFAALVIAREKLPDVPFVFVSGTIGEDRAVEAMKRGATDYVLKDRLKRLVPVIKRALQEAEERSARRRAEEEISRQRAFLRQVIDLDRNLIFAKDREGRFTLANQALADFYGCPVDYPLGRTTADINPDPERVEHIRNSDLEVLNTLHEVFIREEQLTDAAGRVRWHQVVKRPLISTDGKANMVLGVATDITERKQADEQIRRLNRVYAVLSGINATIVRVQDRQALFNETCRIAVEQGGFGITWIGMLNPDNSAIVLVACGGVDSEWLSQNPNAARDDILLGQGMVGRAIREKRAVFSNDITAEPTPGGAHRKEAIRRGYRSLIVLPLIVEGVVVGNLSLFAREPNFFNEDEVDLLTELAGNLSFALEHIARQQKLEKLSRIRAVSSGINAAIVRIRERETLLSETCRIAVDHGNFAMVWVGALDLEKQEVRPVAWAGFSREAAHGVSWASISAAQGTLAEAIRSRRPAVCNDIEAELGTGTLRQEALKMGCSSTVCLPLVVDDNVVALIVLFATGRGLFDEDELALLNELAADVSFALDHLDKTARLDYLSYYDSLTGIPNRRLFRDRMELALAHARRRSEALGVIVINLDRFKKINESLGTDAGDELLRKVASRLQSSLREVDTIARLGGNEYAVLVEGVTTDAEVIAVADKLAQALDAPFDVRGHEVFVSASIGSAVYPNGVSAPQVLLQSAESAMRRVKQEGGGGHQLNDEQPSTHSAQRLDLENRLRHALENGELAVHYQPKVSLLTGAIMGAEALLRWNHPKLGLISPAQFIPIAEETGLIIPIGSWVLRAACTQTAAWHRADYPIEIAVNLSPRQFRDKNLVNTVAAALTESGLAAKHLELEITEGTAMSHAEHTVTVLGELHALDVKLAVDDFGTGYSSLSYLKRFPLDCLKIDRSFVSDIGSDPNSEAIVPATVALAHSLQLKVVAEGIETEVQRDFLASAGCDEGQGYLYSRPLPAAEFGALLGAARNTPPVWGV